MEKGLHLHYETQKDRVLDSNGHCKAIYLFDFSSNQTVDPKQIVTGIKERCISFLKAASPRLNVDFLKYDI